MVTGVSGPTMTAHSIGATTHNATAATTHSAKETSVKNDRRSNKPIMEKRRRARINNCLNELKTLILDATKKDPARHSKLEKADILEKTVKHLQDLQRQQNTMQQIADPKVINKFRAGFVDCINEVNRFPNLDPIVKRRLLQHLHNCINGVKNEAHNHHPNKSTGSLAATAAAVAASSNSGTTGQYLTKHNLTQLHSLPSPPSSPEQDQTYNMRLPALTITQQHQQQQYLQHTPHGYFLSNGLQVVPTKLSNGSVALVLPENLPVMDGAQQQQPLPLTKSMLNTFNYMNAATATATATVTLPPSSCPSNVALNGLQSAFLNTSPTLSPNSHMPPSPANSYEAMEVAIKAVGTGGQGTASVSGSFLASTAAPQNYNSLQPLSLVVRKQQHYQQQPSLQQFIKEEEQPWRPW